MRVAAVRKYINVTKVTIRGHRYYAARLLFPPDPVTGVRPRKKDFYGKSAAEAHAKREAYRAERHDEPKRKARFEITFAQFLEETFLPFEEARCQQGQLSETRLAHRRSRIERFILRADDPPSLASTPLSYITVAVVEDFFHQLTMTNSHHASNSSRSNGRNNRGLTKPDHKSKALRVTAETYNLLRRDLILAFKLAKRRLPLPREEYFEDIPDLRVIRKPKQIFDADTIVDLIWDDLLPPDLRLPIAFEFVVNCRPSEMFALRWADVDFRGDRVSFHAAMVWTKHEKGQPAYRIREHGKGGEKSDRIVPMPPELTALLRSVQKDRLSNGPPSEYVFCRANGEPYNKDTFDTFWQCLRETLGLPLGPTFYSLKTLGNSWARSHGVSGHAQAAKMGHTSTRMSDTSYRTLLSPEMVKAVDVFRPTTREENPEPNNADGKP